MIKIGTVCSGIGSPEASLEQFNIPHEIVFACEIDKYARASYLANFKPKIMLTDMTKNEWTDPELYCDIIVGGIPCQSFSLAGLRKGELDPRGLLFYDFHRYVKKQQPKAFVIENVKGLLSDQSGKTFQNWLLMLGDTVNGHIQMFPHELSLGYNLHWTVLNTKDFGIPQNRERIFLVGIRPDIPNTFRFPTTEPLKLRLKDILEPFVEEKYYLSEKMLSYLNNRKDNFNNGKINYKSGEDVASCINASSKSLDISDNDIVTSEFNPKSRCRIVTDDAEISPCIMANQAKSGTDAVYINETIPVVIDNNNGNIEERNNVPCIDANYAKGMDNHSQRGLVLYGNLNIPGRSESSGRIYSPTGIAPTITTMQGGGLEPKIIITEATQKGYAEATDGDSINLSQPHSTTRRGRVGKQIANTLDTACNQAVVVNESVTIIGGLQENQTPRTDGISPTLTQAMGMGGGQIPIHNFNYRIRRLTPLECWRLQGFSDVHFTKAKEEAIISATLQALNFKNGDFKKAIKGMSNSQLYKQAGNSMSTNVIGGVINNIVKTINQ